MDRSQILDALRATGERLMQEHPDMPRVLMYVIGGVAGMLSGELEASRTTGDCDVIAIEPTRHWAAVAQAANDVAPALGINSGWLNGQCEMYAWQMALGWKGRCRHLGDFGRLRVMMLSRGDLIISKVMGAPIRVQDRDDLRRLSPSVAELEAVEAHCRRLEMETAEGECDAQRSVIAWLKGLLR